MFQSRAQSMPVCRLGTGILWVQDWLCFLYVFSNSASTFNCEIFFLISKQVQVIFIRQLRRSLWVQGLKLNAKIFLTYAI